MIRDLALSRLVTDFLKFLNLVALGLEGFSLSVRRKAGILPWRVIRCLLSSALGRKPAPVLAGCAQHHFFQGLRQFNRDKVLLGIQVVFT
jgi:hypothetical protein